MYYGELSHLVIYKVIKICFTKPSYNFIDVLHDFLIMCIYMYVCIILNGDILQYEYFWYFKNAA